ncbi:MAG: hypothetical protein K8E66_10205 [Phycisphaerales bacterium]|nr:hypothetical protein [Phycisphaerales bacterium]
MRIKGTTSAVDLSIASLVGAASAQALWGAHYHVSHNFNLDAPAADAGRVTVYEFRHVWARGQGQQDEDHTPQAQDPAFDPYGTESPGPNHAVYNSGFFGNAVRVFRNQFVIPNTGSPGTPLCISVGLPQGSNAEAFGVLDLQDINAFVLGFIEMLPIADLNGDGIHDLADVGIFIESFLAGCPGADG